MIASKLRTSRSHREKTASNLDAMFLRQVWFIVRTDLRDAQNQAIQCSRLPGVKLLGHCLIEYGRIADFLFEVPFNFKIPIDNIEIMSDKKVRRT